MPPRYKARRQIPPRSGISPKIRDCPAPRPWRPASTTLSPAFPGGGSRWRDSGRSVKGWGSWSALEAPFTNAQSSPELAQIDAPGTTAEAEKRKTARKRSTHPSSRASQRLRTSRASSESRRRRKESGKAGGSSPARELRFPEVSGRCQIAFLSRRERKWCSWGKQRNSSLFPSRESMELHRFV